MMPAGSVKPFVDELDRKLGVWPLWFCPLRYVCIPSVCVTPQVRVHFSSMFQLCVHVHSVLGSHFLIDWSNAVESRIGMLATQVTSALKHVPAYTSQIHTTTRYNGNQHMGACRCPTLSLHLASPFPLFLSLSFSPFLSLSLQLSVSPSLPPFLPPSHVPTTNTCAETCAPKGASSEFPPMQGTFATLVRTESREKRLLTSKMTTK
jgi:hypothetical protein